MRSLALRIALVLPLICVLAPPPSEAGGRQADYERALRMSQAVRGKVRGANLVHTWVTPSTLVYRSELTGGGWTFLRVDAETGERGPAFDHAAAAKDFAEILGRAVDPAQLELMPLGQHGGALLAQMEAMVVTIRWTDADTGGDTPVVSAVDLADVPSLGLPPTRARRSQDGRGETSLLFVNRLDEAASLFWIDGSGEAHGYGTLAAGTERAQHTYAGHLWEVRRASGAVLGRWLAVDAPGVIHIRSTEDVTPPGPTGSRPSRRQSPDGKWRIRIRGRDGPAGGSGRGIQRSTCDAGG